LDRSVLLVIPEFRDFRVQLAALEIPERLDWLEMLVRLVQRGRREHPGFRVLLEHRAVTAGWDLQDPSAIQV